MSWPGRKNRRRPPRRRRRRSSALFGVPRSGGSGLGNGSELSSDATSAVLAAHAGRVRHQRAEQAFLATVKLKADGTQVRFSRDDTTDLLRHCFLPRTTMNAPLRERWSEP